MRVWRASRSRSHKASQRVAPRELVGGLASSSAVESGVARQKRALEVRCARPHIATPERTMYSTIDGGLQGARRAKSTWEALARPRNATNLTDGPQHIGSPPRHAAAPDRRTLKPNYQRGVSESPPARATPHPEEGEHHDGRTPHPTDASQDHPEAKLSQ